MQFGITLIAYIFYCINLIAISKYVNAPKIIIFTGQLIFVKIFLQKAFLKHTKIKALGIATFKEEKLMERVYNFSAGPATLPLEVLEQAKKEFTCYGSSGMSVMEMSHRSGSFAEIIGQAESLLRELMNVPQGYKILFLQGGASTQFAMVPLNLLNKSKKADYVRTGQWAKKAQEQAEKYGDINVVASSEDKTFSYIPKLDPATFTKDADYFHIVMNNTIYGTRYTSIPDTGSVPLVADMSSCILSEDYDVSKFGIIYAGAQKNIGPAGVTIAIVKESLVGNALPFTPIMLNYKTFTDTDSLYNTPPTFAIYMSMLVFQWLKKQGGVSAIAKLNAEKAGILYDYLDNSKLFNGTVVKQDRSMMNVPFVLPNDELNAKFIKEAGAKGFVNLKGHKTVGGMRASIYNPMPREGVVALVDFMKKFEVENGGLA